MFSLTWWNQLCPFWCKTCWYLDPRKTNMEPKKWRFGRCFVSLLPFKKGIYRSQPLVFRASVRGVSRCPGVHKMIQQGGKERGPQFFSTDIVCVFGVACLQLGLDIFGQHCRGMSWHWSGILNEVLKVTCDLMLICGKESSKRHAIVGNNHSQQFADSMLHPFWRCIPISWYHHTTYALSHKHRYILYTYLYIFVKYIYT